MTRLEDLRAAQFRVKTLAEGKALCVACRGKTSEKAAAFAHPFCGVCWHRIPLYYRALLTTDPDGLHTVLTFLERRSSVRNAFRRVGRSRSYESVSGWTIQYVQRKGEKGWLLSNPLGAEMMVRPRIADLFDYYEQHVLHNIYAKKPLIR